MHQTVAAMTLPLLNQKLLRKKTPPPLVNHRKLHDKKVKRQFHWIRCSLYGKDPPATNPPPLEEDSLHK
eukprot:13092814-Ditylum_brightwellii.AAC.1